MHGYSAVGLFNPKCNANVGGVLRAAQCYGVSLVAIQGQRYARASTDTTKAYKHIPLIHGNLHELVPFDCIPIAVDLVSEATSLHSFSHPERAFYVFGPEDSTLGKDVLDWCAQTVYIPTNGCMNLAATVNVVLYDRQRKRACEERVFLGKGLHP